MCNLKILIMNIIMNKAIIILRIATISLLGTLLFLSIVPHHPGIIGGAVLFNQI